MLSVSLKVGDLHVCAFLSFLLEIHEQAGADCSLVLALARVGQEIER